jgi:hypothetical protein
MGNEECRKHYAYDSQRPFHEPVVFRTKANIKDRQPDCKKKAVNHPDQDQNLNGNGYRSQNDSSL